MTILDTSVIVSLLKGTPDSIKNLKALQETDECISVTVITAYELLKGANLSSRKQENLLNVKTILSSVKMLDLTTEATIEAAQIYATLKKSGKLVGEFDLLIAAIAKVNDEEILTRDQHFEAIPSLKLRKWLL
jgi:tRNA(fMet)-specific endonuclease VapC